jgi:hypothetical protein
LKAENRWNQTAWLTVLLGGPVRSTLLNPREEIAMNNSFHQLAELILLGISWALKSAEALWEWSWSQIAAVFAMSWANLPPWKIALGVIAIAVLASILVGVGLRAWETLARMAASFWTMAMTLFALLTFVVAAGLMSRGFQWVVASVPDRFWDAFI